MARHRTIEQSAFIFSRFASCTLALSVLSCEPRPTEKPKPRAAQVDPLPRVAVHGPSSEGPKPVEPLLNLPESAYSARLSFLDDDLVLITPRHVRRLGENGSVWSREEDYGHHAMVTARRVLYWSDGTFRSHPLGSSAPARFLTKTDEEPSLTSASEDDLAWVEARPRGGARLKTLGGNKPRTVYETASALTTLLVHKGHAFFVERGTSGSYRLGRASLSTPSVAFSTPAQDRPPAMLAAAQDSLFFYGGLEAGVRELSFDFIAERVVRTRFICSPIAVARDIYCASVPGISALPRTDAEPILLSRAQDGPITHMIASDDSVAWVTDTGPDRLAIRRLKLPKR